jgi:hypothetical protein
MLTIIHNAGDQVSTAPIGDCDQSMERISAPISLAPASGSSERERPSRECSGSDSNDGAAGCSPVIALRAPRDLGLPSAPQ